MAKRRMKNKKSNSEVFTKYEVEEMNKTNLPQKKTRFNDISELELFIYKKKSENEKKAKSLKQLLVPKIDEKNKIDIEIRKINNEQTL